jgi:GNAT superfamily N-acetyltransferase
MSFIPSLKRLGFSDMEDKPIGWVTFGPKADFPKINRSPTLATKDFETVWSIPCFFIHKDYRGMKVASKLLEHSIKILKKRGATVLEGYPVKPYYKDKIPAAFAWTGTVPLFEKCKFGLAGDKKRSKLLYRLSLK